MITLTATAAEKLGGIMDQKGMKDTHALRVFVKGGGCGGMQYGMTFDEAREGDEVYEQHGMKREAEAFERQPTVGRTARELARVRKSRRFTGAFRGMPAGASMAKRERGEP